MSGAVEGQRTCAGITFRHNVSPLRIFDRRSSLRPAEVDFAEAGYGGDEGWFEFVAEAEHFGDGEFECSGHVLAGHVAGSEDEFADGVFFESVFFQEIVADAFVRGQQDPAP